MITIKHLDSFENGIPNKILNRGLDYYESGLVERFKWKKDKVDAIVLGSEDYRVKVAVHKSFPDEIPEWDCDC